MSSRVKYIYCRYCGARLRRDPVGQYCTTKNCQWQHGLPNRDDTPTKRLKAAPASTGKE